ncbi:MAG: hypothetical protein EZS28_012716 [Streblomastix strix]|uniref:Uncharacterized protein n=1 Tax=Streblomastix strix TaxID=222440 RepID=A0A5J4WAS3_9EUKA|nr:MAG: hypothetical protein EZS28_012716 [Streblomastix strix]
MQSLLVNLPENILAGELWREACLMEVDELRTLKSTDEAELLKFGVSPLGWQHTLRTHWDAARAKETGNLPKKLRYQLKNKFNMHKTIKIILHIMFIGCLIASIILLPFAVSGRDTALEKEKADNLVFFFSRGFTITFLVFFIALMIHRILMHHVIGKYTTKDTYNSINSNKPINYNKLIRDLKRKKDEDAISHDKRQIRRLNGLYTCFFFANLILSMWADIPLLFGGSAGANSVQGQFMDEMDLFNSKNESEQQEEEEQEQEEQTPDPIDTDVDTDPTEIKPTKWNIKIVSGSSPFLILAIIAALGVVALLIVEVIISIKLFDVQELNENGSECGFFCFAPPYLCLSQDEEEDRDRIEAEINEMNMNQVREVVIGQLNSNTGNSGDVIYNSFDWKYTAQQILALQEEEKDLEIENVEQVGKQWKY